MKDIQHIKKIYKDILTNLKEMTYTTIIFLNYLRNKQKCLDFFGNKNKNLY
jgi:hypothetical protein